MRTNFRSEAGIAKLIIPSYSLAEPHEKLTRQSRSRKDFASRLEIELKQLLRTASYTSRLNNIQEITSLLIESNQREKQRFIEYRERLVKIGEAIALTADLLTQATSYEIIPNSKNNATNITVRTRQCRVPTVAILFEIGITYDLSPQDTLVYGSVISHLDQNRPKQSCFLNRNSKDFDSPDIVEELNQFNCKMMPRFDRGYNFIRSQC